MKITKEQLSQIIREELTKTKLGEASPSIKFHDDDNELSGFKINNTNPKAKKPDLEHLQFLADLKLKRLGTPHPVYDRTAKGADGEAGKIIKIYNDEKKLLDYFTRK